MLIWQCRTEGLIWSFGQEESWSKGLKEHDLASGDGLLFNNRNEFSFLKLYLQLPSVWIGKRSLKILYPIFMCKILTIILISSWKLEKSWRSFINLFIQYLLGNLNRIDILLSIQHSSVTLQNRRQKERNLLSPLVSTRMQSAKMPTKLSNNKL